jgi:hypothetical protein
LQSESCIWLRIISFPVPGRISMKSRIDRREFLGAALALSAGTACRPEPPIPAPTPAEQPVPDFELDELTVRELQTAM